MLFPRKIEGKRCVISNVFRTKESEFTLTNSSTLKEKILGFAKSEQQNYSSIEMVINEYEPMNMFNVIVKTVGAGKLQITNRGLSLKEYKVIGDGETTVTVTIFENLCNSVDINKAYKLTNLQIVTYKNERKL